MKAILVVSFGTSYEETRKQTIEAIEQDIAQRFGTIYRGWTSKKIMAKILKRDGIKINTVKEALTLMKADGVTDVIIQPTHIMNGIENDMMKADALTFSNDFKSIAFGNPLLTTSKDMEATIQSMVKEFSDVEKDRAIVLMGHGTEHYANMAYAALDYGFKAHGFDHFFVGTVEGYPELDTVQKLLQKAGYKKVMLAPFMIVAGDHANNDLVGDDEDSWLSVLKADGYDVTYRLTGLGAYQSIRDIFLSHIEEISN